MVNESSQFCSGLVNMSNHEKTGYDEWPYHEGLCACSLYSSFFITLTF